MRTTTLRNFHVPLPDELYSKLRAESKRSKKPATVLVRQAIEHWLRQRQKDALHDAIARYAGQNAGTGADLDRDLEAASIEYLLTAKEDVS